jgi:lipopolysaccharide export system permease protein
VIRILDRLIVGTFLRLFTTVLLIAAPPLFIIGDIAENLDTYIDRGLGGIEVMRAYAFQLPLFIQWSFPIAALIGTVFTVHSMTIHREIVAAKAGGISFYRLIAPLIVAGVALTFVALGLTEVVPRSNRIAAQILRADTPGRSWRSDFVYQSEDGLTWQVKRLTAADGRMTEVVIERPPTERGPGLHVIATGAAWDPDDGWTLAQGYMRRLLPDSTERALEFDRLRMTAITERPEELLEVPPEPDEMTYAEIDRMARIIQRTGGDARELLVKREQKLSIPVATLVIILFGAPLATSNKRGGAAFGIGISLATVIGYLMLFRVAAALGEAGALAPLTAAWIPNIAFAAAAALALVRVRT